MNHKGNINQIPAEFTMSDSVGLVTKELGKSAGSEKIYANLDCVPAGAYSTKYHSHTQQEEFFYVLSGKGKLRFNDTEQEVTAGDFIAKPSGKDISHTYYNSGSEPLLILDIGTVEKEDTCYYPDEDVYLYKSNGKNRAFKGTVFLEDWTSEPNQ